MSRSSPSLCSTSNSILGLGTLGEPVTAYVAALKALTDNCSYGTFKEFRQDFLVCGVTHDGIQRKL